MKKSLIIMSAAIVSAVLVVVLWLVFGDTIDHFPDKLIGNAAPSLQLATLESPQKLEEVTQHLNNKVTVITIWASWCVVCEKYNHELQSIKNKYDMNLIGVAHKDKLEDSIQWIQKTINPFTQNFYDPNGEFSEKYQIVALPESVIIDKNGLVIKRAYFDTVDAIDEYMRSRQASVNNANQK